MSIYEKNIKFSNLWMTDLSGSREGAIIFNKLVKETHENSFLTVKEIIIKFLIFNSGLPGLSFYGLKTLLDEENSQLYKRRM